jgi:Protein of unknown function (DUF2911)
MRFIDSSKRSAVMFATLAGVACGGDGAGSSSGARTFVSLVGTDTFTVESFTRTDMRIEGLLVERNPSTHRIHYAADLATPNGHIARLEAEMQTPNGEGGWDSRRWTIDMGDGVATVTQMDGDDAGTHEVELGPGAIPSLGRIVTSMFTLEQAFREASAMEHANHPIQFVSTRPTVADNIISRRGGDTVSVSFFGNPMKFWAENGDLMGVSGEESTMKQEVRLATTELDFEALSTEWAERDSRGEGLGTPSPAATVTASVGDATVEIRYSQPAMRGREIWGGLVPDGVVWRMGANAATHFTTSDDLMVGDVSLPAGTYTLWSLYDGGSETLIINSQTNQWGTAYDEEQNLGLTVMTPSALDAPAERFTISISDGMLHMDWDSTRYSVPIATAQ